MTKRIKFMALALSVAAVSSTGCFFGESILSAGAKLASGQISQLTAGELQILNQSVIGLLGSQNPGFDPQPLTTEQAEAVSNFLKANNLNTFEDFEALAKIAEENPELLEGLDELAAAFEGSDTNFDPDNFTQEDLDQLLAALFGGADLGGFGQVGQGGSGNSGNTN